MQNRLKNKKNKEHRIKVSNEIISKTLMNQLRILIGYGSQRLFGSLILGQIF